MRYWSNANPRLAASVSTSAAFRRKRCYTLLIFYKRRARWRRTGLTLARQKIDLDKLRAFKSGVVSKLTTGLASLARARKVQVVTGTGSFVNTHHLEAETQDGTTRIQFRQAIIAAGSEPVK